MHLIFDFDGTLVDSFQCVVEQLNHLSEYYDFDKMDINRLAEFRNLHSEALLATFNIPFYKMPQVLYKARQSLHDHMPLLRPFQHIPNTIKQLVTEGFSLGIVSLNSKENIVTWLKKNDLFHYFDFIYAGYSCFGKQRILKKIRKEKGVDQAFYIGDETRDIYAAKQSSLYSMAVTWGFNSEQILSAHEPDCIARSPEDIVKLSLNYKSRHPKN